MKFTWKTSPIVAAAVLAALPAMAAAQAFPEGSKMAELAQSGKLRVGIQTQYPLIGLKTFTGYEGFDIEVARMLAEKLGIPEDGLEFVPVSTPTREPFLEQNKVDMVIAAYTMTPTRAEVIDFAGPYLPSPNGILAPAGNPANIREIADLAGKHLCAASGSSQEAFMTENFPDVRKSMVFFDSSAKCAQAVINGQADASTTEVAILASLASQNDGKLEVLDVTYGTSHYGIGLPKSEDKTFCRWINATLEDLYQDGSWAAAYDKTIGTVVPGGAPEFPELGASCPAEG